MKGGEYVDMSREMIPLKLAWSWTIWKAQGQTFLGNIIVDLGKEEKEHGLTYVAFSRVRLLRGLGSKEGWRMIGSPE